MNLLAFKTYFVGFLVTAAYDDLSNNKIAIQSPIYPSSATFYGARNAVDRNTLTCMRTEQIGRNSPYKTMLWKVDLGGLYNVYSIDILFKNYDGLEERQRGRFAGFSLYVSTTGDISGSTLCYKNGPQLPPLNFTTVCTEYGRYVIFYNERLDAVTYPDGYEVLNVYIEMCEVKVQGCNKSGVYGSDCNIPCPTNCKDDSCHIQNGTCSSCKPGWTGISCEKKCKEWWFGGNCSQQCVGHCRDNTSCNHVTGQCDGGCDAGWNGYMCQKECVDGTFGFNCVNNCSGYCSNDSLCNKQTGHCDSGCYPGYSNSDCGKNDLSYNKIATQSPIYPGSTTLYGANNAVDRNTLTCMRTEQMGRNSPYKTVWWKVDLGELYYIYSINILFKNYDSLEERQRGRFAGFSLYVSTTGDISGSTLCYKNGPQLPPLNFTTVCTEYGRYVIFYNERLDAVTYPDGYEILNLYTELCEVVVQECDRMWYGVNCSQRCVGHCKDNDTCNHVTGRCDGGCNAGWTQSACDKECDDGTYGFDCVNNCSGHCLNDSSCEKQNGQCKNGCNPGYTNLQCDEQVLQHPSNNKDNSTSTTFLLISVTINIAFITGCFLLVWGIYTKRVSIIGFNHSCWKRSEHYTDTDIKTHEDSNYQELGPPREEISMTYQNTILQ